MVKFIVTHDIALYGLVEGDAWVMSDGKLFLYGLVTGNLHIADTGSAFIHGAVDGTVINNGGYVEVLGTIVKAAGLAPLI